jgi:hypothetical protein
MGNSWERTCAVKNYISRQYTAIPQRALQARDRIVVSPHHIVVRLFGGIFLLLGLAAVAMGIAGVLGTIHVEGNVAVAFVVGGIFALTGYSIAFYRSQLEFDLTMRRWRHEQGVPPLNKVREGDLSDWNHVQFDREQRTASSHGASSTVSVWTVKLRSADDRLPPLSVTGFEFPSQFIDRAEAIDLARELAGKLNLPLREADIAELTPLPPVSVAPLSRPSVATLPPPPSSRIGVETLPDGTTSITLSSHPWKALPALLPLAFFGVFIWQAEQSHRSFLSRVPATSREFFSHSPTPIVFFSPMLVFAAIPFLVALAYNLTRKQIRITPEQVIVFSSLLGRQFGHRSVPRQSIRGVQFMSSTGNEGSVPAGSRSQPNRDIVIVSDQTDLRMGGNLPPAERDWLEQTIHALLSPTERELSSPKSSSN